MTEPTETERAALNERLWKAMGSYLWRDPCDGGFCTWPPDFTRDPAASRELALWLASHSNDKVRVKFLNLLLFAINQRTDEQIMAAMMGGDHDAGDPAGL